VWPDRGFDLATGRAPAVAFDEEVDMAKFLTRATYTADGVKGLMKEGASGRQAAVEKAIAGLGGKVEAFYFALGDTDVFLVVDAPDATAAVALSLAVNATGAVRTSMTPLLTVAEMDAACKKSVAYRAPGA
jgi:uncharacterized protein with GYD domain